MPAPKNPNTAKARAAKAINDRQRKLDAAAELLRENGAVVILPGEAPAFVLRGTDELAVPAIAAYRNLCEKNALLPRGRVVGRVAQRMLDWQRDNPSKVARPDKTGADLEGQP